MHPNIVALRRAAALIGPDVLAVVSKAPAKGAGTSQDAPATVSHQATQKPANATASPASAAEAPIPDPDISHQPKQKRGRPRGGIREAARLAGVPESYYRRHMAKYVPPEIAHIAATLAPGVKFSPAGWLKITRCETRREMGRMIDQLARAARLPRAPTPTERLKWRLRELETQVRNLENELRGFRAGTTTVAKLIVPPAPEIRFNQREKDRPDELP